MNTFETRYAEIRAMPPSEQAQRMAEYQDMCILPVMPEPQYLCEHKHECCTVLPKGAFSVSISKKKLLLPHLS
jgi:hypothetical protein